MAALLGMVCAQIGPEFILVGMAVVVTLFLAANVRSILVDRSLEITTAMADQT